MIKNQSRNNISVKNIKTNSRIEYKNVSETKIPQKSTTIDIDKISGKLNR